MIELQRGFDLPTHSRRPGSVPVVSSCGISGFHDEGRVEAPGVVTGRYGTLGEVFYLTGPFWPLNTTLFVRDFKGNDPQFVSYLLRTVDFLAYSDKAAVPGVNRNHLHEAIVRVPPVETQRRIAGILGALDDKIDLNRRLVESLETGARQLFTEWVVAPAAQRLPAGWSAERLGSHLEFVRGCSYQSTDLAPSATAMVTLKSFARGGGYRQEGLKAYTGRYKPTQIVTPGEIVLAVTDVTQAGEVIGRPAMVRPAQQFERLVVSQDVLVARIASARFGSAFLLGLLSSQKFTNYVRGYASGTTVLHLDAKCLPAFSFSMPPQVVVDRWEKLSRPMIERAINAEMESQRVAAIRDALLPRLLEGEMEAVA